MPFSAADLDAYLSRITLSTAAIDYIRRASIGLSRDVATSGYPAVAVEVPSHKMGWSVVTESRRGEQAFAIQCEYDSEVFAYYEQPPVVDCVRTDKRGVRVTRAYHPDYLVLYEAGPAVIQIKPEDKLRAYVQRASTDWTYDGDRYHDHAADAALAVFDLPHRVVSIDSLRSIRIANLQMLLRIRSPAPNIREPLSSDQLRTAFRESALATLATIAKRLSITDYTPLYQLVDRGTLHCDLDHQLLTDVSSCLATLLPELLPHSPAQSSLVSSVPPGVDACPPLTQAAKALSTLEMLSEGKLPERTARRHKTAIAKAAVEGIGSFLAVTPKTYRSGNRKPKRQESILDHAKTFALKSYGSPTRPSLAACYRAYKVEAEDTFPASKPVSRPTFANLISRSHGETAQARGGLRLANAHAAPTSVSERVISAQRPFETATCDHYMIDLDCVILRTKKEKFTAKAWLTVLKDIATDVVLSVWIALRKPSRIACAMVMRSCLRRHGRLPEAIVVDRGSEFRSVYFSSLLASLSITLIMRPTSHPRYGSEAERFYGGFKTQWLIQRPGNAADRTQSRAVSASHSTAATAELDLATLLQEVWTYCDWQQQAIAPARVDARALRFEEGIVRFPFSGVKAEYDQAFVVASAVDTRELKLDPARGLRVGAFRYWHPALVAPHLRASHLEVRTDPEDHTTVYVRVDGSWLTCVSSGHVPAQGQSEIARIAMSIALLDSRELRAAAKDAADRDLVERLRECDSRAATTPPAPPSKPNPLDDWELEDDEPLSMPRISTWEGDQ